MANWILKGGLGAKFSEEFHVNPYVGKVIATRMSLEEAKEFLIPNLDMGDPFLLPDMDKAVSLIGDAINNRLKIRILGDYDVDGISSSAILYTALKLLDADVDVYLPKRMEDGYGINKSIVESVLNDKIKFVISCDNGIREYESIQKIKDAGITFVLTDHHEPYVDEYNHEILPNADAVVNPSRKDSKYPQSQICGAAVAYLTILALSQNEQFTRIHSILPRLLSFAALGTICDIMPLVQYNRKIVYNGLKELSERPFVGLKALCDIIGLDPKTQMNTRAIGFQIGPCFNAAGRLEEQNKFFSLWYEEDYVKAYELASELVSLNSKRQQLTDKAVVQGALQASISHQDDKIKVLYIKDCHESLAGLVASNLLKVFHAPVLVFTDSNDGFKGSGRSVEGYNLIEHLNRIQGVFSKCGGHEGAAGFSIEGKDLSKIDKLRELLNQDFQDDFEEVVEIDAQANMLDFSLEMIKSFDILEPFGKGNPIPLFGQKGLSLTKATLSPSRKRIAFTFSTPMGPFEAYSFAVETLAQYFTEEELDRIDNGYPFIQPILVDVVFSANINEYKGTIKPQIIINHMRRNGA